MNAGDDRPGLGPLPEREREAIRPRYAPEAGAESVRDRPLVISLRPGPHLRDLGVTLVVFAIFVALTINPPPGRFGLSGSLAPLYGFVAALLLVLAGLFAWRVFGARRWTTVVDAAGVHEPAKGRMLAWSDVERVPFTNGGRQLVLAPRAEGARAVVIDIDNGDHDAAEVLAAIERFSRAAGRELELPTRPPARA